MLNFVLATGNIGRRPSFCPQEVHLLVGMKKKTKSHILWRSEQCIVSVLNTSWLALKSWCLKWNLMDEWKVNQAKKVKERQRALQRERTVCKGAAPLKCRTLSINCKLLALMEAQVQRQVRGGLQGPKLSLVNSDTGKNPQMIPLYLKANILWRIGEQGWVQRVT